MIFYLGDFLKGNGPSTVDIELCSAIQDEVIYKCQRNQWLKLSDWQLLFKSKVLHVSGVSILGLILAIFVKIVMRKTKVTFTMHGDLDIEKCFRKVPYIRVLIQHWLYGISDQVFPVSSLLAGGNYSRKVFPIPNGVAFGEPITGSFSKSLKITLIGGGRAEKRNLLVCQTILKIIKDSGADITVSVYGEDGPESSLISNFEFVTYYGFRNKLELIDSLRKSKLFIQYSHFESFSLSVADAINAHCKVITSNMVGINEYLVESDDFMICHDDRNLELAIKKMLFGPDFTGIEHSLLSWEDVAKAYKQRWGI